MNHSTVLFTLAGALLLVGCSNAQSGARESDGIQPAPEVTWLTDLEEAKAVAAKTNRPILVNFTGSDWCPPCMQLKKDVLSTDQFATYASEILVLLELDFPRRKPQSEDLQRQNQTLAGEFESRASPPCYS